MQEDIAHFLEHARVKVAAAARRLGKAAGDEKDPDGAAQAIDYEPLRDAIEPRLKVVAKDGARAGLDQVGAALDQLLSQANEAATAWAEERAGELVKGIDETTRQAVADLTAQALREGWSNDDLADALDSAEVFGPARAERIARTETAYADVAGNLEGYRASGVVAAKRWIVADAGECDLCAELDGEEVGLDEDFPGDGGDGPPLHPNCVLPGTLVSAAGVAGHFKRWFEGEIISIFIAGKHRLSVTPNHPILTARGWVAAGKLRQGDHLVQAGNPGVAVVAVNPDDHHVQTSVEEIADALLVAGGMVTRRVPMAAEDFHGDGVVGEDVDVVLADRVLEAQRQTPPTEDRGDPAFVRSMVAQDALLGLRNLCPMHIRLLLAADSGVGSISDSLSPLGAGLAHAQDHGGAGVSNGEPEVAPALAESGTVAPQLPAEIDARLAGHVALVEITEPIGREKWAGHVFNLQTDGGWYLANGLVVHNCRCDVLPVLSDVDT